MIQEKRDKKGNLLSGQYSCGCGTGNPVRCSVTGKLQRSGNNMLGTIVCPEEGCPKGHLCQMRSYVKPLPKQPGMVRETHQCRCLAVPQDDNDDDDSESIDTDNLPSEDSIHGELMRVVNGCGVEVGGLPLFDLDTP